MNEHDMYLMYLPSFSNWRIHRKKDHIEVSKSYKLNIKAARTQLLGQYYNHYKIKIKTVLFFSVSYFYFLSLKSLEKKTLRIYFNNFRSQEGHSKCTIDTQLFCITADYLKNKLFVPLTNNLIINNSSI